MNNTVKPHYINDLDMNYVMLVQLTWLLVELLLDDVICILIYRGFTVLLILFP